MDLEDYKRVILVKINHIKRKCQRIILLHQVFANKIHIKWQMWAKMHNDRVHPVPRRGDECGGSEIKHKTRDWGRKGRHKPKRREIETSARQAAFSISRAEQGSFLFCFVSASLTSAPLSLPLLLSFLVSAYLAVCYEKEKRGVVEGGHADGLMASFYLPRPARQESRNETENEQGNDEVERAGRSVTSNDKERAKEHDKRGRTEERGGR